MQQKNSSHENHEDLVNLKNYEISIIRKALQNSKFNQTAAANILGITRDALNRKMKKYNIVVSRGEED
jgi:transcriptional regulator with PAS, ATPase and Fis domain